MIDLQLSIGKIMYKQTEMETDEEWIAYYNNKLEKTNSLTAQQWSHRERCYKRSDPEGWENEQEKSQLRYRINIAKELTNEQLQSIIDSRT